MSWPPCAGAAEDAKDSIKGGADKAANKADVRRSTLCIHLT